MQFVYNYNLFYIRVLMIFKRYYQFIFDYSRNEFFFLIFSNRIKTYFIRFIFINAIFIERMKFDKMNIFKKNRVNEFF